MDATDFVSTDFHKYLDLPKSRSTTVTSDASTIKAHPPPQPAPPIATRDARANTCVSINIDDIFSTITLPDVKYTQKSEELRVIDDIDHVLQHEDSRSYRSSTSSLNTPMLSPAYNSTAAHDIATKVVKAAIIEHHNEQHATLVTEIKQRQAEEQRLAAEELRELEDHFNADAHISRRSSLHSNYAPRGRSMTMDSTVSAAESRFGGFDVHDNQGYELGEEINLYHDEVPYERPKKVKSPIVHSHASFARPPPADVRELEKVHGELTIARGQIEILESEIAKQEHGLAAARSIVYSNGHFENNNGHRLSGETVVYEEDEGVSEIAKRQIAQGTQVGTNGTKKLFVPLMREVAGYNKTKGIHKIIVGGEQNESDEDKTVLLFGPVGSGKTSLINSMLNYLYDVKKSNPFRFVVSESTVPSRTLRAYVFTNTVLPFRVTVVDTPGVPDVKGDRTVSSIVHNWFEQELLSAGSFRLDSISVVLKHDERRLEWPFIHELAAVKRMFGDDLRTNVLPIITHTEVLPQPVAVRALVQANIGFLQYYKVNNAGLMAEPVANMTKLNHNLYFRHAIASLEIFFKDLQELVHPLLAIVRSRSLSNASGVY